MVKITINKRIDATQALQKATVFKGPHGIWPSLVTSAKNVHHTWDSPKTDLWSLGASSVNEATAVSTVAFYCNDTITYNYNISLICVMFILCTCTNNKLVTIHLSTIR